MTGWTYRLNSSTICVYRDGYQMGALMTYHLFEDVRAAALMEPRWPLKLCRQIRDELRHRGYT